MKIYWRIKKLGKWTWSAAHVVKMDGEDYYRVSPYGSTLHAYTLEEEE